MEGGLIEEQRQIQQNKKTLQSNYYTGEENKQKIWLFMNDSSESLGDGQEKIL